MMGTPRERRIVRRPGESFLIGDAIEVIVETVENGSVRLRCYAPGSVVVSTRELVDEIAAENRKAVLSVVPTLEDLCLAQEESWNRGIEDTPS